MAIAYDNSTMSSNGTSAASFTFAHTCTGTDLLLLVFVQQYSQCTGVTYNGVSMTAGGSNYTDTTDGAVNGGFFYLTGPATGSHNVVISYSPNTNLQGVGAISHTGCHQTTPIGAHPNYAQAHATTVNNTITTQNTNSWVVDIALEYNDTNSLTVLDGSDVKRNGITDTNFPLSSALGSQSAPSIGSYSGHWGTASGTNHFIQGMVEIRVAAGAVATAVQKSASTLMTMGIG